jgi:glycosyltransferase involved in cell wall biosynthesis
LENELREQCDVVLDSESEKLKAENLKTEIKTRPSDFSVSASQHVSISASLPAPRSLPPASFPGFKNQSELPAYYAAADVLVLPSESETWGLVVNEAMACGLPAIVSDAVGCAPDLIEEGKTGFTYPVGDVDALAGRLAALAEMKLAGHDFAPALAEKMRVYSVEAAVRGTVEAVQKLAQ